MTEAEASIILAPRKRWSGRLRWAAVVVFLLLVLIELVARFAFGLGSPPLMQADPAMEYIPQPNQAVRRFGNFIHYNAYSMRADDFPEKKSSPDELRILAIGDSIINGGAQTDQAELATSIVQRELAQRTNRKVVVGNASTTSWGPGNWLAYVKKFGFLDADILLIVISSHDAADALYFDPVINVVLDMPDHKPLCATSELITRYLWPRVRAKLFAPPPPGRLPTPQELSNPDVQQSLAALREMIAMARAAGVRVIVAQAIEYREANGNLQPGHDLIRDVARESGVDATVDFADRFNAEFNAGRNPWRDKFYHPNAHGQRLMADVLLPVLERHAGPTTQSTK